MNAVIKMVQVVCTATCLAGCGKMDSKELAEIVKGEMQRDLVKQDVYSTLKLTDLTLVHKDGVNYEGVAKGDVQGMPVSFEVKCEYDGTSWLWKAEPSDHNSLSVMSHKGCQYAGEKFDENWPKVKKGAKESYDAAKKKSGELCEKTKESYHAAVKKTGEWYDETKGKAVAGYNELKEKIKERQKPAVTNECTAVQ